MTNKEAIINLNHIYGFVSPDIQRSLDLAIKALEFAESQRMCCDNCTNLNRKSKEVCTSPYGLCEFFEDKSQKGSAE